MSASNGSDRDLVRCCLQGDTHAFDQLVQAHQRVLYNVAVRMVRDADDARDIVQTTFVKAYKRLDTYDENHKFFSWIYRILMNEALNHLARRKRTEPLDGHEHLVAPHENPEHDYTTARRDEAIEAALRQLSFDHQTVIVLRHFVILSYAEIAACLGITEPRVKSRLFEARRRLGSMLVPWSHVL